MWLKRVSPHMPLGKLGLSRRVGWGEGAGPSGHREEWSPLGGGSVGGSWNLEKPTPTLDSHSNHGPQAFLASTGQFRAQALLRELWIVHSLTPGWGLLVGLLPSVSSLVGGGGLRPTRCRPR